MSRALALLQDLTADPSARMIAVVAQQAGLNPLKALGVPEELTLTPDVALLLHELLSPPKEGGQSESELDDVAARLMARMDLRDSRHEATRSGYRGPRGTATPTLTRTARVTAPEWIGMGLHPDTWARLTP